jgi:hypothetical protein
MTNSANTAKPSRPVDPNCGEAIDLELPHDPGGVKHTRSRLQCAAVQKAEKRKANSVRRVKMALEELRNEIGRAGTCPEAKLPELSLISIAKRAHVDRKTLNQTHHAGLKRDVLKFIAEYKQRTPNCKQQRTTSRFERVSLAHDQIAIENRMLRRQISELTAKVAALEAAMATTQCAQRT